MQGATAVEIGQYSTAGRKPLNQDSMAACVPGVENGVDAVIKGAAFAVADGISSSEISQIAAETAVKSLVSDYYATPQAWTVKSSGRRVIEATNSWLYAQNRHMRTSDMNLGLVCTLSVLIIKSQDAHIFHVGDSRISRVQPKGLEPLTQDHTTVHSDTERYLGRALGAQHRIEIDYQSVPITVGDIFLLTTDGVHDFISTDVVHRALESEADLTTAAQAVAKAALDAGSNDNLTVQFVRVTALPKTADAAAPLTGNGIRLPLPTQLSPSDTLDGFLLLRELHHTQRSQVYLASDAANQKLVIKIPGTETGENPEYLQRFLFEEWVARRVTSPHVVKAAPGTEPRSASYVAMQWIEGVTLRQWITDNPEPDLEEVRGIAEQLVRGLRALHRQEMIHQDLRPENIMLDTDGTVVIIDLGSVSVAGLEQISPDLMGAMPGTFQYTAPEYLSQDNVSWRSDQYALGVIVYEMLTGQLPYGAQVARVRNRRDQQRLKYRKADVGERATSPWVDFALARACHRDPTRRYDALSEFLADLRKPASGFKPLASRPLMERNPLKFWQGVALLEFVFILALVATTLG